MVPYNTTNLKESAFVILVAVSVVSYTNQQTPIHHAAINAAIVFNGVTNQDPGVTRKTEVVKKKKDKRHLVV